MNASKKQYRWLSRADRARLTAHTQALVAQVRAGEITTLEAEKELARAFDGCPRPPKKDPS